MSSIRSSAPVVGAPKHELHSELAELVSERRTARVVGITAAVTRISLGFVFPVGLRRQALRPGRHGPARLVA